MIHLSSCHSTLQIFIFVKKKNYSLVVSLIIYKILYYFVSEKKI